MEASYKICIHFLTSTGCDAYRSFLPFRHCQKPLAEEGITLDLRMDLDVNNKYDAYVFHRHMSADFLPVLYAVKMNKSVVIWDLDDQLFEIPKSNPAHAGFGEAGHNSLTMYLAWSDYVTCSTAPLAKQLIDTYHVDPNRLAILPNLIDPNDWHTPPINDHYNGIKVMWAGSASHHDDLLQIVDPIIRITKERDDVRFMFVGMMPDELTHIPWPDKCSWYYGCEVKYYARFLCDLAPDISLAPIVWNRFNEAKSAIKWMEGTLAGAATIASDMSPYSDAISHCETGMLCNPDEWYSTINGLLDNPNRIEQLRHNAAQHVISKHSWRSVDFHKWMGFFRHVAHTAQSQASAA